MRIAVDIDEVLAEHVSEFRSHAAAALGVDASELDPTPDWDFVSWFGEKDLWKSVHSAAITAGMLLDMKTKPGAAAAVNALRAAGHEIIVCTSRVIGHDRVVGDTCRWLALNGIVCDDLVFLRDKSILNADLFIDDAPHHAAAFVKAGHRFLLWDTWYNQNAPGTRVRSWEDVLKAVGCALDRGRG